MKRKRILALLLCLTMILTTLRVPMTVFAAEMTAPQSVTLNAASKFTMYTGMSRKLKVKSVKPKTASKKVTFKSSDESVVRVTTSGTMKALTEGKAVVTVASAANPEVSKEVKVTVKNLVKNKTYNKMVIALDKKPRTRKLSRASKVKTSYLKFSSSKKKVATVSAAGTLKGKKAGNTKITIGGKKGIVKGAKQVITLYVAKKSVETVALDKTSVTLKPTDTVKLTTTVTPEEAANVVVYTTSDEKVAVVNQSGDVTALQEGTAEITATTVDGSKKAVCKVAVKGEGSGDVTNPANPNTPGDSNSDNLVNQEEPVNPGHSSSQEVPDLSNSVNSEALINEGIQIANGDETLYLGEFIAINAFCFPYSWANQNDYILSSSNEDVVTVDEGKVAYAVGEGEAQITAVTKDGAYYDTINVKVLPPLSHSYESNKIYDIDLSKFGIVTNSADDDPLAVDKKIAYNNCDGIMSAMKYATVKGYDVVRFPEKSLIYIDPLNTIYMKSGISLDLNGSELRILPNAYTSYQAIIFKESSQNVFNGFLNGTKTTYDQYTDAEQLSFTKAGDSIYFQPIQVCQQNSLYNTDNYSGKWLEKGERIEINSIYVRDKNANAVFYLHYLKDGKEVLCEKKESLYGVLNDTLLNQTQVMKLSNDCDYDSVQLELRSAYDVVANYTFCNMAIRTKPAEKLCDASIVNGTITGERSTKNTTYSNWSSDAKTEASCSIVFSQGENNGIKNLTVKDSVGFNMSSGDGNLLNAQYVSYKDLESGAFDENGKKIDCSTMIRNSDYYDVTKWSTNKYILGYHFGYQDVEQWSHSRIYDVFYYDQNKELISYEKGIMRFRQYEMPEGTCYINIALYDADVPTSGNTDFYGAISLLEERDLPIRNFIEGCVIENNYSTGFAACGGQRWSIKGNTWCKNGGRMPGCDIDWEDGWNYMQCDMISENEFMSYNNVITCAGMYSSVFHNNKFYGITWMYPKCNYYAVVNNSFIKDTEKVSTSTGRVNFASRSDIWIYNNTFSGNVVSNQLSHANAQYRMRFINNHFINGYIGTDDRMDVVKCDFTGQTTLNTYMVDDCTFVECGYIRVSGTIRNSKIKKSSIVPLKGCYENCEIEDVVLEAEVSDKNTPIIFNNCRIKSSMENFFTVGVYVYHKNYLDIRFQNCVIEHTGENLIRFVATPNGNSQILFENCQINKNSGYLLKLFQLSSLSDASVDVKFIGTEIDKNLLIDEKLDATKVRVQYDK